MKEDDLWFEFETDMNKGLNGTGSFDSARLHRRKPKTRGQGAFHRN